MMTITNRYNCDYLVYDEPISIEPRKLIGKHGIDIEPGMKISQIGTKARTSFTMLPGKYMEYEGILEYGNLQYAIFNCPDHNIPGAEKQYRYAFACVFINDILHCLISGCGTGCRDIVVDSLVLFSPCYPPVEKKAENKKYEKSAGKKCSNVPTFQQAKNRAY